MFVFGEASVDHVDLYYEWANDEDTRANSFCSDKIIYEEHVNWFKNKLKDDNAILYICKIGKQIVGQVRIECSNRKGIISYSVDRNYRGLGFGKDMINAIESDTKLNDMVDCLIGCVKKTNIPSQKIFEQLGYVKNEYDDYYEYIKELVK